MFYHKSWISNNDDEWIVISENEEDEEKHTKDEDKADEILQSNIIPPYVGTIIQNNATTVIKSIAYKAITNYGLKHRIIELGLRALIKYQNPHNAMIFTVCLSCYTITMFLYIKNKNNKSSLFRAYRNKTQLEKS